MKKKICTSMSVVTILILGIIAVGAQPNYNQGILLQTVQPDYVPGQAIVGFYGPLPYYRVFTPVLATHGIEFPYVFGKTYGINVLDTNDDLCAVLYSNVDDKTFSLLQRDENVKYVQRNYILELAKTPHDPDWEVKQWGPKSINAPAAWDITTGSSDVIVAVIDTGIDYTHPDLKDNYLPRGYDWVNNDNDPMDDFGHGTHCAGIIGAVGDNPVGIAGVNWKVSLIAEKVIDAHNESTSWNVASGIVHACNNGARIISMSFGRAYCDVYIQQAVEFAHNKGCLLVAASGNYDKSNADFPGNDKTDVDYPASDEYVIAVGAINQKNERCTAGDWGDNLSSNIGPELDLMAPGNCIYSTMPTYPVSAGNYENDCTGNNYQQQYDYMSGTSMACPHVAGIAALMLSVNPDLTNTEIECILKATAVDLGTPGRDDYYGYGLVDAYRAVSAANFRYSIDVTPSSQVISVPDSVSFEVKVNLIQGTPQTVNLSLDTDYYPPSPYTYSFSQSSGVPPFKSTLTIEASSPQLPKILRVEGSSSTAGCAITRHSNFFTVSTEEPIGDIIWIKTSSEDDGTVNPRQGAIHLSPSIWSEPDPPRSGTINKLWVRVSNLDPEKDSGQVLVQPYFNEYPFTIPIKDFPSLDTKTIDNIPPKGSVPICWDWMIPAGWPDHVCVFVQAWRPGYEDFDESFNIQINNNIAQKNFVGVYASSSYKTVLTFENPTNNPMEMKIYMEAPDTDWTVDLCMPSYYEEGCVVTPLIIPPKQRKDLQLTIIPGLEREGAVNIWYTIKGYEKIYPDLTKFTFYVKPCGCKRGPASEKPLTGIYSTFNLHHDVVEMYVRVVDKDYSNLIYDIEICREDQQPMWDSIEVLETPAGWSYEDLGCGVRFYTETDPLIKCQRVRFVFRVTAERISWHMRMHVTDKNHQNVGMVVGTRWWLYHYPV